MAEAYGRAPRAALLTLALVIGTTVTLGERVVFAFALSRDIDLSEAGVLITNGVLVALPFAYLALCGCTRSFPWLLGLTLTLAVRWWWLADGIAYQRAPDGSGANIGGAMLMLLSPFVITAIVAAVHRSVARH